MDSDLCTGQCYPPLLLHSKPSQEVELGVPLKQQQPWGVSGNLELLKYQAIAN